jgi:hypothetical protein
MSLKKIAFRLKASVMLFFAWLKKDPTAEQEQADLIFRLRSDIDVMTRKIEELRIDRDAIKIDLEVSRAQAVVHEIEIKGMAEVVQRNQERVNAERRKAMLSHPIVRREE